MFIDYLYFFYEMPMMYSIYIWMYVLVSPPIKQRDKGRRISSNLLTSDVIMEGYTMLGATEVISNYE